MVGILAHQEPKQFLQSHVWGCDTWHDLSYRCRQRLERLSHPESLSSAEFQLLQDQFAESLLDCYVHTRVCSRYKQSERMAKARHKAAQEAQSPEADAPLQLQGALHTEEQDASDKPGFSQHRSTRLTRKLDEHSTTRPTARFSVPAWNIEFARSQRF